MRDIKFRAYIRDKNPRVPSEINKIVEVKSLHLGSKKAIIGYSGGNYSIKFDEIELMQYTGLKDKNGKEIYEGDIVKVKLYKGEEEKYFVGKVEYFGSSFIVDADNDSDYHVYDLDGFGIDFKYNLEDCEVIGNVWEDSDLLNDNKNTESY